MRWDEMECEVRQEYAGPSPGRVHGRWDIRSVRWPNAATNVGNISIPGAR